MGMDVEIEEKVNWARQMQPTGVCDHTACMPARVFTHGVCPPTNCRA